MSKIITAPNPVLGQITKEFNFKNSNLSSLLKDMEKALLSAKDPKGVGLAAPQIGKLLAIFITKPTEKSKISVFINPRISASSNQQLAISKPEASRQKPVATRLPSPDGEANGGQGSRKLRKLEGCLSLPNIWGEVLRAPDITLSYFDQRGKKQTKKFSGFMSTVIQHEMDHLEGILFPRRVLEQKAKLYKSHKNEKGEDEFEELEI